jgi:hypothetical protein
VRFCFLALERQPPHVFSDAFDDVMIAFLCGQASVMIGFDEGVDFAFAARRSDRTVVHGVLLGVGALFTRMIVDCEIEDSDLMLPTITDAYVNFAGSSPAMITKANGTARWTLGARVEERVETDRSSSTDNFAYRLAPRFGGQARQGLVSGRKFWRAREVHQHMKVYWGSYVFFLWEGDHFTFTDIRFSKYNINKMAAPETKNDALTGMPHSEQHYFNRYDPLQSRCSPRRRLI